MTKTTLGSEVGRTENIGSNLPHPKTYPLDVLLAEPQVMIEREEMLPSWEVGKIYKCANNTCAVLILSTKLRSAQNIAGILLANDVYPDNDEVHQWTSTGQYLIGRRGVLDLTSELVTL